MPITVVEERPEGSPKAFQKHGPILGRPQLFSLGELLESPISHRLQVTFFYEMGDGLFRKEERGHLPQNERVDPLFRYSFSLGRLLGGLFSQSVFYRFEIPFENDRGVT